MSRPISQLMKLKVSEMTPEECERRREYKQKYVDSEQSKQYFKLYYQEHKDEYNERRQKLKNITEAKPKGRPRKVYLPQPAAETA